MTFDNLYFTLVKHRFFHPACPFPTTVSIPRYHIDHLYSFSRLSIPSHTTTTNIIQVDTIFLILHTISTPRFLSNHTITTSNNWWYPGSGSIVLQYFYIFTIRIAILWNFESLIAITWYLTILIAILWYFFMFIAILWYLEILIAILCTRIFQHYNQVNFKNKIIII